MLNLAPSHWASIGVISMTVSPQFSRCLAVLCLAVAPSAVLAQRPHANTLQAAPGGYNVANDSSLQGTILSYTENSKTPPLGTHVLLQTASGNVDVHLGDARLLHQVKLNLTQGMSVRFVGQPQTAGRNTVFLARLVQVGSQMVAVRSNHGLPVTPGGQRGKAAGKKVSANQPGGAR
jgi:hypothetical protein